MKKIKLIPSLILLALCIAILGIGIYAAAPAGNTITGTVTVTAANAEVEISVYQDNYYPATPATNRVGSPVTTRTGSSELSMGDISFNASSAENIYDVPLKEIIIVVKNHSTTQDLGMYFWKTTAEGGDANLDVIASGDEQGCVQVSDVLFGHYLYDAPASAGYTAAEDVFDVEYEFYKHIPVAQDTDSDEDIDETDYTARAEMIRFYIRLNELVENPAKLNLNVHLNIEKYVSNYSSSKTGFVKVGVTDLTSGTTMPTAYASGLTHVTLPFGTTAITSGYSKGDYYSWFGGGALLAIGIPNTVTSLAQKALRGSSSYTNLILPDSLTTIGDDSIYGNLTSLVIPRAVSSIGYFSTSNGFKWLSVNSANTYYDNRNNCSAIIETSSNTIISGSSYVFIPNTVVAIGNSAFDRTHVTDVIDIPSSVTSIGHNAFRAIWGISNHEVIVRGTDVSVGDDAFGYMERIEILGSLSEDYELSGWSSTHWEKNGSTVSYITSGVAGRGVYVIVHD